MPVLVWLAPVPWLVYLDRARSWTALLPLLGAFVLVNFLVWRGIIPAPGLLYYLVAAIYAVAYFLPFALHRLLAAGPTHPLATLVFPAAWVAVEFVFQRWITPYGSWASFAYTQDSLPLLQLTALGGTAAVSFIMTWFAAVAAWLLRRHVAAKARIRLASGCALVLLAVFAFGQVRLAAEPESTAQLRVAGLAPNIALDREVVLAVDEVRRNGEMSPDARERVGLAAARLNTDLLHRSRIEAQAGARLVAWSETGARVLKSDEAAFLQQAIDLAREEQVSLFLGLGVWHPGATPPLENKVVAIDPSGGIAWEVHKAHPIVGAESPFIEAGDGIIRALEVAPGLVGAAICHDFDFPALLHQAGVRDLDLLIAPANDWLLIARLHARMAAVRSIEQGVALLRPTSGGRSFAVDALGRPLAIVDAPGITLVAEVPLQPRSTLYGRVGDLFAWLCVAGLLAAIVAAARRRYSRRQH